MMNNDWYQFMQSRPVRVILYSICTVFCAFHAMTAVRELMHPETQAVLVESIGTMGFYALTGVRLLVLVWAGAMFVRMVIKTIQETE